jgi:hypothetical protein
MKQIAIAIPDDLRARIEAAATTQDHSIAEEIRRRLERTFEADDDPRPDIRLLSSQITLMTIMAERLTGRRWDEHPAVTQALKIAIGLLLQRHGADDNATFKKEDWPTDRLYGGAEDPKAMAAQLEWFSHHENIERLNDAWRAAQRRKANDP